jgi:hypothetical protein
MSSGPQFHFVTDIIARDIDVVFLDLASWLLVRSIAISSGTVIEVTLWEKGTMTHCT